MVWCTVGNPDRLYYDAAVDRDVFRYRQKLIQSFASINAVGLDPVSLYAFPSFLLSYLLSYP